MQFASDRPPLGFLRLYETSRQVLELAARIDHVLILKMCFGLEFQNFAHAEHREPDAQYQRYCKSQRQARLETRKEIGIPGVAGIQSLFVDGRDAICDIEHRHTPWKDFIA